jgi:hypothetical protein
MIAFYNHFMQANTMQQVSDLVNIFGNKFVGTSNEKYFYNAARLARIRISRIRKESLKSWSIKDKN